MTTNIVSSSITVERNLNPNPKPHLEDSLLFGTAVTDHMLEIDWTQDHGWGPVSIKPHQLIPLDPCSSVLHYGTECFEGLKAFLGQDGKIRMFRPEMNMARMRRSAAAVGLPDFDDAEFLKCLEQLVLVDQDWVPHKKRFSLYIRPALIGTHAQLGVVRPKKAKLFAIMCAVGPYFPEGFIPAKVYCDENVAKAWPGGAGDRKIGGNYGPTLSVYMHANKLGYHQVLWLTNNNYVTELGSMNFFVLWKNAQGEEELITCPDDSTILPGVMRDTVLQLAREWKVAKVSEQHFTMEELVAALEQERVIEIFGSSTTCVVCPISQIHYRGVDHHVPLAEGNVGTLTRRLREHIMAIQYGEVDHAWAHLIRN